MELKTTLTHKIDDDIDRGIDKVISAIAIVAACGFSALLFAFPSQMDSFMTEAFWVITTNLGFLWEAAMVIAVLICAWLVFGPLKNRRFGNSKPEGSSLRFFAMIFVGASSASIIYWVFIEFFLYLETPPWNAEAFGYEALKWASAYSSFHWGIAPFCAYALIGICFAYFIHVQKKNTSRVSAACSGVIGEKHANGLIGRLIDATFLIGIVISVAGYSLGVSVPIVGAFAHFAFGIENDIKLQAIIIIAVVIACSITIFSGLKRGMAVMSAFRARALLILAAFIILFGGNAFFALNNTWESIGWQLQHFVQMCFNTGVVNGDVWPQSWTIFFFVMMLAATLSMGLYYAALCKGRTVRECVLAIVLSSTVGNGVFFWTIGNHTLATYLGDPAAFREAMAVDPYNAIMLALQSLPFSELIILCFLIYAFVSIWTFAQSAIYSMAMATQPNLPYGEEPKKANRLFWCVITGVLAIALLNIGGLQTVKNAILWAGIPGLAISAMVVISQGKDAKKRWLDGEEVDVSADSSS